jgi:small conductance mechanosensitive channel
MDELELDKLDVSSIDIAGLIDTYVIPWGLNIIFALVIFIVGKWLVGLITRLVKKLMGKANVDNILVNFIGSIIKSVLLLFVVIAALDQLGVNTTSLIALIGAAGLAIGLALQGSLQNLASGVMLIIFRPFRDGDFVEAGGATGVVEEIGIFTTKMRTGDNKEIIVPNGQILAASSPTTPSVILVVSIWCLVLVMVTTFARPRTSFPASSRPTNVFLKTPSR